jgi:hypothetical protein
MVQLIPDNANPTMAEIDEYLSTRGSASGDIDIVIREIRGKSGVGALLHPAEVYFMERVEALDARGHHSFVAVRPRDS